MVVPLQVLAVTPTKMTTPSIFRWPPLVSHRRCRRKTGAPSTPGLAKSTVASANIEATATIRRSKKSSSGSAEGLNKTLAKSLDSRRSSSNSKKAIPISASPLRKTDSTASVSALRNLSNNETGGTIASSQAVNSDGAASAANTEVRNPLDNLMGP
ncbi:hypothetical protein DID88_001192 [Monilinia fructigena]|uniref:Uncharacterized protein n=1 Tax=Monilinia fructigena TaxID=38457 RepID=A0A395IXU5_9HELO|nr:hypothetical protein DID88_001192 [Monilinia fructigena]